MAKYSVVPFAFESFSIRTLTIKNMPWFVAEDVCSALNLSNPTMSLKSLDDDERSKLNLGRQGKVNIINESGMYTLILRCRDAIKNGSIAHRFRKWVTSEVLPSIRKTGGYQLSKRNIPTNIPLSCPCCHKPVEVIKIHQHHRHHTEIIAICNSHACQQDALKYDLNFSYYIELKDKIESDNKDVLDKLSYKKRLALIELLSD
ncbi:Bro-N domain-containing protein [Proteus mirabilis]|uniref:BRO-N domain-containing protein n=1 Tax=Proteus mirabilis TaxID=584 RepID=UPI00073B7BAF|nr:BRO family protein [Proteus mirabilis]KSX97252.1 hypothetical protein APT96_08985 [Proteus mirabilis]